jgi:hypothetical protein
MFCMVVLFNTDVLTRFDPTGVPLQLHELCDAAMSCWQQGLMAVGASPRDPLNTLASVGGAAHGARLERSCRAQGLARRTM